MVSITCSLQCLFEPRVIEFEQKRLGARAFSLPGVTDEIIGLNQKADAIVSFLKRIFNDAPSVNSSIISPWRFSSIWRGRRRRQ